MFKFKLKAFVCYILIHYIVTIVIKNRVETVCCIDIVCRYTYVIYSQIHTHTQLYSTKIEKLVENKLHFIYTQLT